MEQRRLLFELGVQHGIDCDSPHLWCVTDEEERSIHNLCGDEALAVAAVGLMDRRYPFGGLLTVSQREARHAEHLRRMSGVHRKEEGAAEKIQRLERALRDVLKQRDRACDDMRDVLTSIYAIAEAALEEA